MDADLEDFDISLQRGLLKHDSYLKTQPNHKIAEAQERVDAWEDGEDE